MLKDALESIVKTIERTRVYPVNFRGSLVRCKHDNYFNTYHHEGFMSKETIKRHNKKVTELVQAQQKRVDELERRYREIKIELEGAKETLKRRRRLYIRD